MGEALNAFGNIRGPVRIDACELDHPGPNYQRYPIIAGGALERAILP